MKYTTQTPGNYPKRNKLQRLVYLTLRRILRPKKYEVIEEWRKLHSEELNDLHCSPNIVQVIKLRRMRWAGHVAHRGESTGVFRVLVGKPDG